jgi:hypothetical protein
MSGDLDLYAPSDAALETALLRSGFVREQRQGRLAGGFYHPTILNMVLRRYQGSCLTAVPIGRALSA